MSRERVLIVDDSAISRALLRRSLEAAGFAVMEAEDGVVGAVEALRELPEAVVTDLEMPVLDGHQLARLIKHDSATAHIPVVILTSHDEAASRFWGLATGADAYVTKEDLVGVLVPTVRELLDRRRPAAGHAENPPQGPMDVLARVVRQLDAGLLEMTLVKSILQKGIEHASLEAAASAVLDLVAEVIDAGLLGLAVGEEQAVSVYLLAPKGPLERQVTDDAARQMVERLAGGPGRSLVVQTVNRHDAFQQPGEATLRRLASFPLPLRDAEGCLAVWPRDWDGFAALPQQLLGKVAPHAALVVDNARLAERMWELSTLDGLTRLLNHRTVLERLVEELARGERYGEPVAVVLCDVDRFKQVNDTYGHLVGDAVLREVAQRLKRGMRTVDIVGRYGGEEFLAVLPNCELEAARIAASRLCDVLAESPVLLGDGSDVSVTASFGVACSHEPQVGRRIELLLAAADGRLYEAKAAGRRCVRP